MKRLYQELMGITRAVLRQAEGALPRHRTSAAQLRTTIDLLRRVVAQTRARILRGDTRFPGKVVSLFEPHRTPRSSERANSPSRRSSVGS
jgi:hypothetical protein